MADIPINPVSRRIQYTGNTGLGPFAFTFNILANADLAVYKNTTLLNLTSEYTVSTNADGTGSITLTGSGNGTAVIASDLITIIGARLLERTTDFVAGGDFFAASINEQLDSQVIMVQQLEERLQRTIKSNPGDELVDMELPLKADRASKIMTFDSDGSPSFISFDSLGTSSLVGANYVQNNFTGNGSQTDYTLTAEPAFKANIQVFIDGVYQNKAAFSLSGTTLSFSEAPPDGSAIECIIGDAVASFEGALADLSNVSDADLNAALAGNTLSSLIITSSDINGGTIDNTAIGSATPSTGKFTTLETTGNTIIGGNLTVNGTTTTINSTTLDVDDLNITVASGAADAAAANGGGITVDGANATFTYASTGDKWVMNKSLDTDLIGNVTGNVTGNLTGNVTGNADTASQLQTARSIILAGDLSGSTSFDGSANVTITASVADDSHNHVISNVDGLQTALDAKAPIDNATFTGTTTAATLSVTGNISVTGTVDGRDVATDGTKLDGIEAGATADQTAGEIKTAYESNADTNAFTDAEKSKLAGIEASADVTDATNVAAAGAVMESDTTTAAMSFVIDEDTMVSNLDTKVPTQQSVKAYVDGRVASSVEYAGGYNAATNTPDLDTSPSGITKGDMYTVTAAGTFFTIGVEIGDVLIAEVDNPSVEADWTIVNKNLDAASIKTAYESNANTNAFTDAEQTKLSGIEAGADVTDTANVTAAGALMDSEVTNLAAVKAFDPADYATAAQGILATTAVQPGDSPVFNSIVVSGTVDGRDIATDGAKLDGIESGATADQTAAEIRALVEAATDSNVFTDADHTKLNGIEASADVTDTANVTAAGALMDSELTNITAVKALNQGVATTDSPTFAAGTFNGDVTIVDKIVHDGNTTTSIRFPAIDTVTITTNGSERLRVDSNGDVGIGTTSPAARLEVVQASDRAAKFFGDNDLIDVLCANGLTGQGSKGAIRFFHQGTQVGGIVANTASTSYNTTSDYRLKENVTPLDGAADRLAQIPVHRFNFIADPNTTVDGFLAHEVKTIVPEAVTGEKDAVDSDGDPVYQGIDQSKLVPLLTAALQEALNRIETLEADVAALKGI